MTTMEVAERLVALCREGKILEAQQELYADDCISLEPAGAPMSRAEGLPAIIEKSKHFSAMIEVHHGMQISDPVEGGGYFSISWHMDVTLKGMGRQQMNEVCLYHVVNGKIVLEQFFYSMPG
jgi:hypothetical protein